MKEKKKAIVEEFDPVLQQKIRTLQDYQNKVLQLLGQMEQPKQLTFRQTPSVTGGFLRGWQMDFPSGYHLDADPRAFLEGFRPQIHQTLTQELLDLKGVKFQLAVKVQLHKDNPDGTQEFTDPVLRHNQEPVLQADEIDGALDRAFPHIQELLEKWTQSGSGWVVNRVKLL